MSFGRGGSRTVNDFGDQSDLRGSNYTNYRDNNDRRFQFNGNGMDNGGSYSRGGGGRSYGRPDTVTGGNTVELGSGRGAALFASRQSNSSDGFNNRGNSNSYGDFNKEYSDQRSGGDQGFDDPMRHRPVGSFGRGQPSTGRAVSNLNDDFGSGSKTNGGDGYGRGGGTTGGDNIGRGGSSSLFGQRRVDVLDNGDDGFGGRGFDRNGGGMGRGGGVTGQGGSRTGSFMPRNNNFDDGDNDFRNVNGEGRPFGGGNGKYEKAESRPFEDSGTNGGSFGRDRLFDRNGGNFGGGGGRSHDFDRSNGGGGFGRNTDESQNYKDNGPSYVPQNRPMQDIFNEDQAAAEDYMQIRDDDDDVIATGMEPPPVIDKWDASIFDEKLLANIERAKYIYPRKIQAYCIPLILDGFDVKGHAETGSGKTAAFLIPIIQMIIKKKESGEFKSARSSPFALIIEPTRELTQQLYDQARKLTQDTDVSIARAFGKYRTNDNLYEISCGCDILIGSPGRLMDFFTRKYILPKNLKFLVFDESDNLLKDQFMVDLREMSSVPDFPEKKNRQTLMFSATFPPEIQRWADEWLREQNVMVSNRKPASANNKVVQNFLNVPERDKKEKVLQLLNKELENMKMSSPEEQMPLLRRTLIFVKTKREADVLATFLCQNNINALTINGDRPQHLRDEALRKFRDNDVQVLSATDVCSRGLDIKDLDHVINMDLPEDYVTYVHRIGRTGRLKPGVATNFFDPAVDMDLSKQLVKGIIESHQEAPQFLIDASEDRLVVEKLATAAEDCAWGQGSRLSIGAAEKSDVLPAADLNDEW